MARIPKNLCEIHSLGPTTREWLVGPRQVPAFRLSRTLVAGHSDARRNYTFVRHQPAFSQVLACTGGEGEVLVDGQWQRCPAGFAYVTAPRALCAYHVRPGRRWQVCWVLYEEVSLLPNLEPGRAPQLVPADTQGLQLAVEGLCHEAGGEAEPATVDFWAALVHRQAMRMLRPGGGDPRLARLWSTVRRDLGGPWDLQRLARFAGLSEESLRRLCQREFGRAPLAHLTRLRMQLAADLLACTQEKIASIAVRVGYRDPFAFSNAFKRELRLPPSRYRGRASQGTPVASS